MSKEQPDYVCEFLSERLHEVKYEAWQLKRQERQLKKEREALDAEFDATDYAEFTTIDTAEYEKQYEETVKKREEFDALQSELELTKTVLDSGELPAPEECIQLSNVIEILDTAGQKVFDANDPNIFNVGLQEDFNPEIKTLLSEIKNAVELLKKCSKRALPPITTPKMSFDFGDRIPVSYLTTRKWLKKLGILQLENQKTELENQKTELENQKTELMKRPRLNPALTPKWDPTYQEIKNLHSDFWSDVEKVQNSIENINRKINSLNSQSVEMKKQVSEIQRILLLRKLPENRVSLNESIDYIDAEVEKLEALEAPNLFCKEIMSEWQQIKPILEFVS